MQDQRLNIPAANTDHTARPPSNIRRYLVAGLSCAVVATLCVVVYSSSGNYRQASASDGHRRSFIPQGYPSQAPTFSVTSSPTYSPTPECVQDWGQCGGTGYNGPTCCCNPDFSCVYNSDYYSQCIPTPPTKSPTFAITPSPTNSPTTKPPTTKTPTNSPTYVSTPAPTTACVQDWGQCGGSGYNGPTCCCSPDFSCVYNSDYYSQCIPTSPTKSPTFAITNSPITKPPTTKTPTNSPTYASTPAPTTACVQDYGQCGGSGYNGPTCCCSPDFSCIYSSDYYSQCIPTSPTSSPTFAITPSPTKSPTTKPPTQTPAPTAKCVEDYGQCGGNGYEGSTNCCSPDFSCVYNNDYYSQCIPKSSTPSPTFAVTSPPSTQCAQDYGQCGGIGYEGPTKCCSDTFYCYYNNDYYSQCVPKNN